MDKADKGEEIVQVRAGYKVYSVIRSIVVYALAIGMIAAALLFAADKSPQKSLFGFRYYTILTPSMAPTYQVGDMVFVKLANADTINVGDVITFNPSSESDAYLTHRVAEKIDNYEGTGVTCFRTKGDANNAEDSFLIDENRVIGAVNFYIPKMGYVFRFVQLRWYFVIALVILIGVLLHLLKLYFAPAQENEEEESETKPETMPSTAQK